jgi:hypothetical protein
MSSDGTVTGGISGNDIVTIVFISVFGGLVVLLLVAFIAYVSCCQYDSRHPRERALCCPLNAVEQGRDRINCCH